jgi:hypothetical protein
MLVLPWGCSPGDEPASVENKASKDGTVVLPMPAPIDAPKALPVPEGLSERIQTAVKHVRDRDLLTSNSFWTVFHGILGIGPDTMLLQPETGKRVNAIEYICAGGEIRGLQFLPTRHGLDVRSGPAFEGQGHQDQFIAEMAQWGMPIDQKFIVGGKDYSYDDFVRHSLARASLRSNQELSWAIIIIGQYRSTSLAWTNDQGEALRFEDLIRYELDQPIDSAACGGTHRLFGLDWAYHLHMKRGGEKTGVWKDVVAKTADYQKRAKKYQNADGSFSTKYLAGPGQAKEVQARIGSTGHVLEWLALSLSDAELREPWVQDAANALSLLILDSQDQSIESGAMYHAAHGLQIYHARVFGTKGFGPNKFMVPLPPGESLAKPKS